MEAEKKIKALRHEIGKHSLSAFLQPVHDEFMSEYPPACNRRVEWLTGFGGSAGMLAVLAHKAALFVDGRYTLQAQNEVDGELYEQHNSGVLTPEAWLARQLKSGDRAGYDPKLHSGGMIKRMQSVLDPQGIVLVPVLNLVDAIWEGRSSAPSSSVFAHATQYSGEDSASKRKRIAAEVKKLGADAAVITMPDAVCWLLNIRGNDVENTPLVLASAIIDTHGTVQLMVSPARCDKEVVTHLGKDVECYAPESTGERLDALGKKGCRVLCDAASAPVWFTQRLAASGATIVEGQDPCLLPKAMKNPVELQGIKNAHIRDGAAVARCLCWLDAETQKRDVSELEVSEVLLSLRASHPMFTEPSFTTISGSGPHGAIVHYRVTPESNRILQNGELFLLDSGGQYPDGTTDITRTVVIGTPTAEHKDRYTRVLKGHIALATAIFPEGTGGSQLDTLARQYLWQAGLDYDHGTGHGVGCFLNVHEGPQRISKRGGDAPLKPGMVVSNEPGYYKAGEYGIRIENLVTVVSHSSSENGIGYLGFETLTCAPLESRLIERSMLTTSEIQWVNDYQAWVRGHLSPALDDKECQWLEAMCAPL